MPFSAELNEAARPNLAVSLARRVTLEVGVMLERGFTTSVRTREDSTFF